jgi:hypothetical protein
MALEFDDDQTADLLDALGLPADSADSDLILATAKDLASQVEQLDPAKPSTVAAAAKRAGMELLDKDTAEALRRDAAEGRRMAAAAAQQRVEASVDDAVRRGKIAPSRRKHWVSLIGADPGMADVLAAVPDNTLPVQELGHGQNPDPGAGGELAEPSTWFYD